MAKVRANVVKAEAFVKAAKEAIAANEGIAGIMSRTGMSKQAVNGRLYTLRKAGVNLAKMPHTGGHNKLDVAKLNEIVEATS